MHRKTAVICSMSPNEEGKMNNIHSRILARLHDDLVSDLDVNNDIIAPLKSEYILKDEDIQTIQEAGEREEQVVALLKILPDRGPQAFSVFHDALKHHYPWRYTDIEKELCKITKVEFEARTSFAYQNILPVPPLTVERTDKINKLEEALRSMESNEYVILHGMKGYGKSSLVASVFSGEKKNLTTLFKNEIYWIRFSKDPAKSVDDEITVHMNELSKQIMVPLQDKLLFSTNPQNYYKSDEEFVKYHFEKHKDALLILDDVFSEKIIKQFDFKCKTLVITDDLDVVSDKPSEKRIEMNDGFSESESLGLFAKALEVNVNQLPLHAKQIHEECKGMPLLIALLAAQFENFKQEMQCHNGRWRHYLDCLRNKDTKPTVLKKFFDLQEKTYEECINQLDEKHRGYYEQFAIFGEDVNITSKTLEILWGETEFEVGEIMMRFCSKSLAARKWNDDLKAYIYGIHDLLLRHLRKRLSQERLRELHERLITKYRDYCSNDFSRLPDDNYSFSYIGHHLKQAGMIKEFPRLYLDLEFLQEKIKHSGLSDLFIDLKKYRELISKKGDVIEIEKFLRKSANVIAQHRLMKCLDLVQIALNYENLRFVHAKAQELAAKKSNKLFIVYESEMIDDNRVFCEELEMTTSTTVFTDDPNLILVGYSEGGKVALWDCKQRRAVKVYEGHSKLHSIKKILVSDAGGRFLALSDDGLAKLFELNLENLTNGHQEQEELRSPKEKQTFWTQMYVNESKQDDSLKTFSIENEIITDIAFSQTDEIGACTGQGSIAVWSMNGIRKWKLKQQNHIFSNIIFTAKNEERFLLHVTESSLGCLMTFQKHGEQYEYKTTYNLNIMKNVIYFGKTLEGDKGLVIVTAKKVMFLKWNEDAGHVSGFIKRNHVEEEDPNTRFVAAHVTYDSQYLIVAKSNGIIYVIHTTNEGKLVTSFKGHVNSLDSYDTEEGYHLICGAEKKWVHGWKIMISEHAPETLKIFKKIIFDAKVGNLGTHDKVVLTKSSNTIAISQGQRLLDTIKSQSDVKMIHFCDDVNEVLYVTQAGVLSGFNYRTTSSIVYGQMKAENFIANFKINDVYAMISRCDNNTGIKIIYVKSVKDREHLIPNVGHILAMHQLSKNHIITVSSDCILRIWQVQDHYNWVDRHKFQMSRNMDIKQTCISYLKTYLAIITNDCLMKLFKITIGGENLSLEPYRIDRVLSHQYKIELSCAEFSNDVNEKFLAVALSTGAISIFAIHDLKELSTLDLHCGPVKQLCWAPSTIETPVLLSVNCNELAWWNVGFLIDDKNAFRRSRMGSSRRGSTPRSGPSPRTSLELNLSSNNQQGTSSEGYQADTYWRRKQAKTGREKAALLTVVQLPVSSTDNGIIFASEDFSKFLTVDINGKVSKYLLHEYLSKEYYSY